MNKIKAVLMDGDGSTITRDGKVPDNLVKFISGNPHIKWVMATGRSLEMLKQAPITNLLTQDVPHIVDGGARLVYLNGESFSQLFLSEDELNRFFSQLDIKKVNYLYFSVHDTNIGYAFTKNRDYLCDLISFKASKLMTTEKLDEFIKWSKVHMITKMFANVNQDINLAGLHYATSGNCIDVTTFGANKGDAAYKLIQKLGYMPGEIAFIFNDNNDLPLVLHPELGGVIKIKVGNYLPNIIANYHVNSPHDVVDILYEILS